MYYKCSICNKSLKPTQTIKLKKVMYDKYESIKSIYFCKDCYKIFEKRLNDYLIEKIQPS